MESRQLLKGATARNVNHAYCLLDVQMDYFIRGERSECNVWSVNRGAAELDKLALG